MVSRKRKYNIRKEDGTLHEVNGMPLKMPGFEEFTFFYFNDDTFPDKSIRIAEFTTGMCLTNYCNQLKKAKEEFYLQMDINVMSNKKAFKTLIDYQLKNRLNGKPVNRM